MKDLKWQSISEIEEFEAFLEVIRSYNYNDKFIERVTRNTKVVIFPFSYFVRVYTDVNRYLYIDYYLISRRQSKNRVGSSLFGAVRRQATNNVMNLNFEEGVTLPNNSECLLETELDLLNTLNKQYTKDITDLSYTLSDLLEF